MQKTSEVSNERYLEVMGFIEEVCKNNLNEEYQFLAESLCKEIFELKDDKTVEKVIENQDIDDNIEEKEESSPEENIL